MSTSAESRDDEDGHFRIVSSTIEVYVELDLPDAYVPISKYDMDVWDDLVDAMRAYVTSTWGDDVRLGEFEVREHTTTFVLVSNEPNFNTKAAKMFLTTFVNAWIMGARHGAELVEGLDEEEDEG